MIGDDRRGGYRRWRTDQLRGVLSYDVRSIIVSDEDPIFNRIRPKYVDPDPPNNVSGAELLSWFMCEIYVTYNVGSDGKKRLIILILSGNVSRILKKLILFVLIFCMFIFISL